MLKKGHWYKFDDCGDLHIGLYMGRERGFECCVCRCGCNAHCFNLYHSTDEMDYETWGYGNDHIPALLEDLGEYSGEIFPDILDSDAEVR
jgi:hypothetical protein